MENCKIVFVKLGFCQGQVEVKVTEPDKNSKTEMHLYVHHRSNMYTSFEELMPIAAWSPRSSLPAAVVATVPFISAAPEIAFSYKNKYK